MALSTKVLKVSVDIHATVGIAHVSLFFKNNNCYVEKIYASVTDSSILVTFIKGDKKIGWLKLTSNGIGFLPLSCSGLAGRILSKSVSSDQSKLNTRKYDYAEVAVRLQCSRKLNAGAYSVYSDGGASTLKLTEEFTFDFNEGTHVENFDIESPLFILCAHCKQKLKETPSSFKRVLNLPSGGWNELKGDFFCHKHNDEEDIPTNRVGDEFLPDEKEFYVNDLQLHFNSRIIDESFIKENKVFCTRCLVRLGEHCAHAEDISLERPRGIVKLYKHNIILKGGGEDAVTKVVSCEAGVRMIVDVIKQNLSATLVSKLYLETERTSTSEGLALLLWVMDRNLEHFDLSIPFSNLNRKQEVPLQLHKVIKVLYGVAQYNSPRAHHWRHDFAVEVYKVDKEALHSLVDHLTRSTENILPSQRFIDDDLCVGYISHDDDVI